MSDFYRKFLSEDVRKMGTPSGRQIFLAAFGKHPGWDDHVEDLGLETESLITAKALLYVKGIGGQIDSGAWEKLDPAQQLPGFKHIFVWQRGAQAIVGRMWSSSDGKGRKRYPMIVAAHLVGAPLDWALSETLPRLEQIEQTCLTVTSAIDVRSVLDRHRAELRHAIANLSTPTGPASVTPAALREFVTHPAFGPDQEGWFRIVYQVQGQLGPFAPGRFSLKGDLSGLRPQQVRLPACGVTPVQTVLLWNRFFQTQVDPAVPVLYTVPLEESWIDVTIGEPTPHETFALRASPKAMPLVSEVPYNLDTTFREKARTHLAGFASGGATPKSEPVPVTAPEPPKPATGGSKFFRWFGGAAVVAVAAGAVFFLKSGRQNPPVTVASTNPAAAAAQPLVAATPAATVTVPAADIAKLQAEARARAEAEARVRAETEQRERARIEAQARAKAEEETRQKAIALEAENRRLADAKAKSEVRIPDPPSPVVTTATPLSESPARITNASTVQPSTSKPARLTNGVGVELILVPGDLWVGKYEVTQGEFVKVMGSNPSKNTGNPRLPVESVTWEEARRFCEKLTEIEKASGSLPQGFIYNLPTQLQWESFVADATFDRAVTSQNAARGAPEIVGSAAANQLGLHDVLGNVWEWCLDGPNSQEKALRGGAFNNQKTFRFKPLATNTVHKLPPTQRSHDAGFRCVLAKSQ